MTSVKRIALLTSGGDAPGMNSIIRAVVRTGVYNNLECLGIRRGYNGLINGDIIELNSKSVGGLQNKGGTILYTARCPEFNTSEGLEKAKNVCKVYGIDALICIGGDGTFRGGLDISKLGVPVICIPASIDNDIVCTNYTIGYDTACNTAIECIDKLRDTMQSHERCSVIEVMGRKAGHLATYVAIATGANAVLVPEREWDFHRDIVEQYRRARMHKHAHFIIIVAEGAAKATDISDRIVEEIGLEPRVTILGHIQRGGIPSARDRVTASRMGRYAVEAVLEGRINRVIGILDGKMQDFDIVEALNMEKDLQEEMYHTAKVLSLG